MWIKKKSSILLFGLTIVALAARGQAAKSPFTYLGIGEPYGNALVHNQGMAGVGISNPQYFFLNNQNPALLTFNRFTVFGAGFIGERRTVSNSEKSETNGNGNLNYLITAFPIKLGQWTTSLGLMPYSSVNYKVNYTAPIEGSTNTVDVVETGQGGINQFYWSNGFLLHRNLSLGIKAAYLFSSIINEYTNQLSSSNQTITYYPTIYERNYVHDITFSTGIAYNIDSLFNRKNYKINVGLVYDFKSKINSEYSARIERRNAAGIVDSTTLVKDRPGQMTLPSSISGGISFAKGEILLIGIDYTYLDYRQFRDFKGRANEWGTKGFRLAVGGEFTPDPTAMGSYLKRITYRTGINYDRYAYLINGMPVKDFGINFGFSLPVSRISSLDLAFKAGKRGDLNKNSIEENYFKVYFGVTFNDQWFIRRRFD
jgi:hypothetical protein